MPYALCSMPFALCAMPYAHCALCPFAIGGLAFLSFIRKLRNKEILYILLILSEVLILSKFSVLSHWRHAHCPLHFLLHVK